MTAAMTAAMTADWFVDTNVLVYSRDAREPAKQERAAQWMAWLWETTSGRLSVQVLQEYYTTVTRKLGRPIDRADARQHVRNLMAWRPVVIDAEVLKAAWHAEDRYGLSWWDALIVGAARVAGCRSLLSEDLQAGQDLGGVVVVDPFLSPVPHQDP